MNSCVPLYPSTKAVLYADDLTLLHNTGLNNDRSQLEIDHLVQWCSNKSMTINVKKCASLTFTFNHKIIDDFFINKSKVSGVNELKLLGIIISKSLNSKSHGTRVLTKAADD